MTNHETDRRAQWASALWEAAEQNTIAEWICCDPIDPKHGLCVAGGKALEMLRALIVDDPEAYKPAPLTTVALELAAVSVPPPAPRADDLPVRLEAVLTERFTELGNPFSAMRRQEQGPDGWPASHPVGPHQVAGVLRELLDGGPVAGEQQNETPEAEAHPPTHTWKVESPRRDTWASWGATYDDREWASERYESAIEHASARAFRLVRATTTYTVEAEHTPAVEAPE